MAPSGHVQGTQAQYGALTQLQKVLIQGAGREDCAAGALALCNLCEEVMAYLRTETKFRLRAVFAHASWAC